MSPSRRDFLIGSAAFGTALCGGGIYAAWRWHEVQEVPDLAAASGERDALIARIAAALPTLHLESQGLDRFAEEFLRLRAQGEVELVFQMPVALRYLMSTDFFRNNADPARLVRYITFYDAYISPCWNPLATTPVNPSTSTVVPSDGS